MSKAILISDHSKWCALIMNGIKNIEVRKNKALASAIQKLINENGFADIYVHCTKGKPNLWLPYEYDCFELDETSQPYLSDKPILDIDTKINGKVAFKFRCYKVEEIDVRLGHPKIYIGACIDDLWCLDNGYHDKNYLVNAIHISDLKIFDKPKDISEFYKIGHYEDLNDYFTDEKQINGKWCIPLKKAPQNFCYVEEE